jgi:pentatricopeptide repeat protein
MGQDNMRGIANCERVVVLMTILGYKPSLATYNALILMYGRMGDTPMLESCLDRMKEGGVEGDSRTHSHVAKALMKT